VEEVIFEQLQLGELAPDAKVAMLDRIAFVYSAKLIESCAELFSELELARMEHMIEQKEGQIVQDELLSHIKDPDALLTAVMNETITELRENMIRLTKK
jgi:hypothetical protein